MKLGIFVHPGSKTRKAKVTGRGLEIYLRAAPTRGKANEELIQTMAKILKIPKSRITISVGLSSKKKVVEIEGIPDEKKDFYTEEILKKIP